MKTIFKTTENQEEEEQSFWQFFYYWVELQSIQMNHYTANMKRNSMCFCLTVLFDHELFPLVYSLCIYVAFIYVSLSFFFSFFFQSLFRVVKYIPWRAGSWVSGKLASIEWPESMRGNILKYSVVFFFQKHKTNLTLKIKNE